MFNDNIKLMSSSGETLYNQKVDSIASKFMAELSGYNKTDPNLYTLVPGKYTIEQSTYYNKRTGVNEPAFRFTSGVTKAGLNVPSDFLRSHKIHRSSWYSEKSPLVKNGVTRSAGAGCPVIPMSTNDILNFSLSGEYSIPTYVIIK